MGNGELGMGNEMAGNVILEKTLDFSVRIVRLYRYLRYDNSGTSIGANAAEGNDAISKHDFLNKMYIALKECSETLYWIELLHRTEYLSDAQYNSIMSDCRELKKILSSITKSTKETL